MLGLGFGMLGFSVWGFRIWGLGVQVSVQAFGFGSSGFRVRALVSWTQ